MEERDRSRSPSRRTSRVEQVVGRWLRRSRDSTSRERVLEEGRVVDSGASDQRSFPIRVTVQLLRDPTLQSHGFTVTTQSPLLVHDVTPGGPADGRLVPGDQPLKINSVAVDDLSAEQAADIIRECQDTLTITVLRNTVGPKSSFITPEKRAKLKSNPVKVRFAEEVLVNGHTQGNSLLFLPNVLKVYLENGQTKAFKFDSKTTVKDIVMTLKEKLSIARIEHFTLVLEQQYSSNKLLMLHEEELIQQVVGKKETHDYRCLFRICFVPRNHQDMLEDDPVAFEYLYLQCVSDVLQERFAVEMKCNTALRLAALHIQERLASSGQSPKTPLKTVTKEWGIESFVSTTLLRNMREKDLRKAISYHMKRTINLEPKQKLISVNQARLNYLNDMGELKSYGGRSFSATLMLQDRESMVSLLVGAQYGVSQVINHKLSIMTTLTEFTSITRVELIPESERVSLVKIYLQDIKPITLLLESAAAKELSCLVAGYCKLMVNPNVCVFPWTSSRKSPRISAEEGYVSRCGSDSEDSDTDVDALLAHVASAAHDSHQRAKEPLAKEAERTDKEQGGEEKTEQDNKDTTDNSAENGRETETQKREEKEHDEEIRNMQREGGATVENEESSEQGQTGLLEEPASEASDSCRTDSHVLCSVSSDSMDALEEDDLLTFFSATRPCHLSVRDAYRLHESLSPVPRHESPSIDGCHRSLSHSDGDSDPFQCLAALSSMAASLPSPPEASEEEEDGGEEETGSDVCVFTFKQSDARHFYNICSSVTPDSARSLPRIPSQGEGEEEEREMASVPLLRPPPGFGDSSSDDEFFDAQERLVSPEQPSSASMTRENSTESSGIKRTLSLSDIGLKVTEGSNERRGEAWQTEDRDRTFSLSERRSRKRRSFLETDFTSLVSFPGQNQRWRQQDGGPIHSAEGFQGIGHNPCPTVMSFTCTESEPYQLESKPITVSRRRAASSALREHGNHRRRHLTEMEVEPDAMETKAVTELLPTAISAVRSCAEPDQSRNADREGEPVGGLFESLFASHLFFRQPDGKIQNHDSANDEDGQINRPSCPDQEEPPATLHQYSIPIILCTSNSDAEGSEELEMEPFVSSTNRSNGVESGQRVLSQAEEEEEDTDSTGETSYQEPPKSLEPQTSFLMSPCSTGIMGRLSASTLRGKIQSLPLYLSRSQEMNSEDFVESNPTFRRRFSETERGRRHHGNEHVHEEKQEAVTSDVTEVKVVTIVSEEVTEVIEEVLEVGQRSPASRTEANAPHSPRPQKDVPFKHDPTNNNSPPMVVVTTQSLNGPWGISCPHAGDQTHMHFLPSGCGMFTNFDSRPTLSQPQSLPNASPQGKPDLGCNSMLAQGCEVLLEGVQTPMEVCGCQSVYTNCFSGVLDKDSFDDELTVYEFSCRTQGNITGGLPFVAIPPPPSSSPFSPTSSSSSSSPLPSFPCVVLPPSNELSPLLSPLERVHCFLSEREDGTIAALLTRKYSSAPAGFSALQKDVETLLSLLGSALSTRGGIHEALEHHRDSCAAHFSENKRCLHAEARGLLAGCQQVVRTGQSPEETLQALVQSFRALVQLASICLYFTSCARCQERHAQALAGLADVTRTYREFARAAEHVGSTATGKPSSCHDLSIKLLARQCTALTTSVFCLTQLFRTLTAL
ncbi:FERM and PDZ domain-containing protein 1 isoform X2 [Denticeps clupeoides]|uniref:FERM and PDZ domain-containing protein 1-like n=1 Tax=Denticeps clupeoides TaxID=299321 RepID=A0AAY4AKH5_9TELE|nr:FERM and PDZ domain-containing protein 1 isoform X2 [Denticeps clupeoides]